MLSGRRETLAQELADGIGAKIGVRVLSDGVRTGLRFWFADLPEKNGPFAELRHHGLRSHKIILKFPAFSGAIIRQISSASSEDLLLARALVESASRRADVTIEGQTLSDWIVRDASFCVTAVYRHEAQPTDSDEALIVTTREVMVPMLAAMAELIGYDREVDGDDMVGSSEGALSQATIMRRERNPRNRLLCLRIHGEKCVACGCVPKSKYGAAGDIIEVHHLEPLSVLHEPKQYSPSEDLVPLCPCCHRAVHTQRPIPFSIEQLKTFLVSNVS